MADPLLAAPLDANGYQITELADGVDPQDAVTVAQLETDVAAAITALALGTAAQKNHGTGSADLPTVAHVSSLISAATNALVSGAPGLLDTLDELAQALGDDSNFAATITAALAGKAPLSHGHAQAEITGLVAALAGKADAAAAVPAGGTAGQVLAKVDGVDFNVQWVPAPAGGGGGSPVSGYESADYEKTGGYVYVGYKNTGGEWFIYRRTLATNARGYATGGSGYSTAWAGRAALTYV